MSLDTHFVVPNRLGKSIITKILVTHIILCPNPCSVLSYTPQFEMVAVAGTEGVGKGEKKP